VYGTWQKIACIDLSTKKISMEHLDEELYRKFSGGSGMAAYLLYQKGKYAANPLGPDNDLIFMTGLLTGTPAPAASKTSVCAKSPLTGIWGESTFGGYWGSTLKSAGYDGLWIAGSSDRPIYLWITPEGIEIRDAQDLWGKNTFETDALLRKKTLAGAKTICIGRAGEKLSKMAALISEGLNARAAGRTGLGAVMGAKKLKGIAVIGKGIIPLYDGTGLKQSIREFLPTLRKFTLNHTKYGTAGIIMFKEATGGLPLKNFSLGIQWEESAYKISGQAIAKTIQQGDYTCFSCPIKCGKNVKIDSGPYRNVVGHGPEYETLAGFGSNLMNDDLESLVTANYLCNDYGLDTISTSVTLAFAFEAFERGLLTRKDCDGLELQWGNTGAILETIRKIGEREGMGEVLADGSRIATQKIGCGSEEFSAHAKGLEPSTTTPTSVVSLALSWATSNRGACHLEGQSHIVEGGVPFYEMNFGDQMDGLTKEDKGRLVMVMQNFMATFNGLGLCKFLFSGRLRPELMARWVNYVTGWDLNGEEIMTIGDRLYNLKRVYNYQLGISRRDDTLTPKLFQTIKKESSLEEKRIFFDAMLADYYRERNWDQNGIPKAKTLQKLGLEFAIKGSPSCYP
jgi:aldehyde:ferredoxin oxidoreductase